ncbi:MAG: hypothetical protein ACHQ7M_17065 [Chloroflexota bacterium]
MPRNYADLARELALSVQGQGHATDKVLAELEDMRTKAQLNLQRLADSGQLGVRPDYEELLRLVAGGVCRGCRLVSSGKVTQDCRR